MIHDRRTRKLLSTTLSSLVSDSHFHLPSPRSSHIRNCILRRRGFLLPSAPNGRLGGPPRRRQQAPLPGSLRPPSLPGCLSAAAAAASGRGSQKGAPSAPPHPLAILHPRSSSSLHSDTTSTAADSGGRPNRGLCGLDPPPPTPLLDLRQSADLPPSSTCDARPALGGQGGWWLAGSGLSGLGSGIGPAPSPLFSPRWQVLWRPGRLVAGQIWVSGIRRLLAPSPSLRGGGRC